MIFSRSTFTIVCCGLVLIFGSFHVALGRRFCGKELVSALSMLCDEYVSLHDVKKNTVAPFEQLLFFNRQPDFKSWAEENLGQHPNTLPEVENRAIANWVQGWHRRNALEVPRASYWDAAGRPATMGRFRRAVAAECCNKDCSLDELLAYCKVVAPGIVDVNVV